MAAATTVAMMPSSKLTEKHSSVAMKVTSSMRTGTPYQWGECESLTEGIIVSIVTGRRSRAVWPWLDAKQSAIVCRIRLDVANSPSNYAKPRGSSPPDAGFAGTERIVLCRSGRDSRQHVRPRADDRSGSHAHLGRARPQGLLLRPANGQPGRGDCDCRSLRRRPQ